MKPFPLPAAPLVALLLAGCTLAPHYQTPALPVPAELPPDGGAAVTDAGLPVYSWRDVFADSRLQGLIGQALANNEDVRTAVANIEAARAQYQIQRAELLPELDANASYRRSGQIGATGLDAFAAQGSVASWEIDVFGRLRSLSGAARNRYLASAETARATRLTLIADMVDAWLNYGRDQSLLTIAQQTADAARQSETLTRQRLTGGVAPRSDLRQAEILLQTAMADVANQTTLVAQDRNALQLLVGAAIDESALPQSLADATASLGEVPVGLQSTILLRRPDVVAAEYSLRAANAQIGAARAALFPKISLTGLLGFASDALGSLFDHGNFLWQGGGAASVPVFQGGAGIAGIRLSEAQRDAALSGYRKVIENAFADVANTLARRGTIDQQVAAVRAARDAAADNLHLADLRYQGGIDSYLNNLVARQSLYSAERSLVTTEQLQASNLVALYRSLGGDPLQDVPPPAPVS